jgi:hypothetical protein
MAPDQTIAQKIQGRTLEEIYGLVFDVSVPQQNLFDAGGVKRKLIDKIKRCSCLTEGDRQQWLKALEQIVSLERIETLNDKFQDAEKMWRFDMLSKSIIEMGSQFLVKEYFDGTRKVNGVRLPPMHGMEEDFRTFYDADQV